MPRRAAVLLLAIPLFALPLSRADDPDPYAKRIKGPSDEGLKAIPRIQRPKGLKIDLTAAEPLLANPVSFCFDGKGRIFVAETFRLHAGVPDNRGRPWLEDELAARTVADRLAVYKKYKYLAEAGREQDRVRLIWSSKENGVYDQASVFAGGFKDPADGLGSGVLARGNKVWYTNIPHLWLLEDKNGDGKAEVKKSLHEGYGVHISFLGHDLHGLRFGPDGKLYFTVGDRGAHIEKDGKVLVSTPDTGAVFRCDPDGANLEIFHVGLRNPQELAFDEHGNLFTGDNNADGGDAARWVYCVEGGDSGWRIGYQYQKSLGPWNAERLWHKQFPGQAGAHLPPLEHIASGPAGLTYNPGVTLLPEKYQKHFFLVDFRGGSGGSGIHAFANEPKGAGFKVVDRHNFVWSILATDCDFGPDGGFYVLDWVEGWGLTGKGRIYKVYDPDRAKDPTILEVKTLLAEGMAKREPLALFKLLEHKDQRIRQEAQFELASRNETALLTKAATEGKGLARLHGIWGVGQTAYKAPRVLRGLLPLLEDGDAEVRSQAAKVLGDHRDADALPVLVKNLNDKEPRVRFFSALALGRIGNASALPAVLDMLRENKGEDVYLRHAGVMALAGARDEKTLLKAAEDSSKDVRHAALLAMRRLGMPEVVRFLGDIDPYLALEAARAINDAPINKALPSLAAFLHRTTVNWAAMPAEVREPLFLRALNANYRQGTADNAEALAAFAAKSTAPANLRVEALAMLREWETPKQRDRIMGLYRPLEKREGAVASAALRRHLTGIMTGPDAVRAEGAKTAARHGIKEVGPLLRDIVADLKRPAAVRVETLRALEALKDKGLQASAEIALKDSDPRLRGEGRRITLLSAKPEDALKSIGAVLDKGHYIEQQSAIGLLPKIKTAGAEKLILSLLEDSIKGRSMPELQLDILEAARQLNTPDLKRKLAEREKQLDTKDHLAKWRESLAGGSADAGKRVFFDKTDLSCVRCHKIGGVGGDVGPDLSDVGKKYKRDYLLESIVDPNKQIAKGFETVVLNLLDGTVKSGVLKSEDKKEVRLVTPEGAALTVPTADIEFRARGPSAMPADLHTKMTPRELRDLVEYLSTLK
ncbi:MAG: PVC-type heme-binding CxxCH protein [Gemmataceae bacterium]